MQAGLLTSSSQREPQWLIGLPSWTGIQGIYKLRVVEMDLVWCNAYNWSFGKHQSVLDSRKMHGCVGELERDHTNHISRVISSHA